MTSASSLAFPGSRTLAAWRRVLAAHNPRAWWVGYLFVHRVEALALWTEPAPLDPLLLRVLEAIALGVHGGPTASRPAPSWESDEFLVLALDSRLHLGPAIARQLLQALVQRGLVAAAGASSGCVTEAGQTALASHTVIAERRQRRWFSFVERLAPEGTRLGPPHYLPLQESSGFPWQPDESFDPSWLLACPQEPAPWKQLFAFPDEIEGIAPPPSAIDEPDAWQRVIVDRPERVLAVLLLSGARLLAAPARVEGWALQAGEKLLDVPAEARAVVPELAAELPAEAWRSAWLEWCHTRAVAQSEAAACQLEFQGEALHIQAPAALVQRLQASKSDIFKGDAWLLAGTGFLRQAARMSLVRA